MDTPCSINDFQDFSSSLKLNFCYIQGGHIVFNEYSVKVFGLHDFNDFAFSPGTNEKVNEISKEFYILCLPDNHTEKKIHCFTKRELGKKKLFTIYIDLSIQKGIYQKLGLIDRELEIKAIERKKYSVNKVNGIETLPSGSTVLHCEDMEERATTTARGKQVKNYG